MTNFFRHDFNTVSPDDIYDTVTQMSCDALADTITAYSIYSGRSGRSLDLTPEAETMIVLQDVPENCPLRYMGKRSFEQFAEACGSCTLSNFMY